MDSRNRKADLPPKSGRKSRGSKSKGNRKNPRQDSSATHLRDKTPEMPVVPKAS